MTWWGKLLYWTGYLVIGGCLRIFFRLRVQGRERLPARGPLLLVANHISLADPPVLGVAARRLILFLAMAELFHHPWLGGFVRAVGCIPVDRSRTDFSAAREAIRQLRVGHCLAIFPEGGIRQGAQSVLGGNPQLRRGLETIARLSRAAVVPVILRGTHAPLVWRNWLRRPPIEVTFGYPFCLWSATAAAAGSGDDLELIRRQLLKTVALGPAAD
jgi:1-acyl-sn-glycerol-3-phosphate acyltransferase